MPKNSFKQFDGLESRVKKSYEKEELPMDHFEKVHYELSEKFSKYSVEVSTVSVGHSHLTSYNNEFDVVVKDIYGLAQEKSTIALKLLKDKHTMQTPYVDADEGWILDGLTQGLHGHKESLKIFSNFFNHKADLYIQRIDADQAELGLLQHEMKSIPDDEYPILRKNLIMLKDGFKALQYVLENIRTESTDMYKESKDGLIQAELACRNNFLGVDR